MRTFRFILQFQAESEVEAGKALMEKFIPVVSEMRQEADYGEVVAYVEEVTI